MGRELDDEVSVEGCADPFQQRDRGDDAAGFQVREGRLGHLSAGCEFDLGQSQGQAAFADRLADEERPAGFGVPLAVLVTVTALGGEFLVRSAVTSRQFTSRSNTWWAALCSASQIFWACKDTARAWHPSCSGPQPSTGSTTP